ncbi:unnamed protein product [Arctogadus glacialis]
MVLLATPVFVLQRQLLHPEYCTHVDLGLPVAKLRVSIALIAPTFRYPALRPSSSLYRRQATPYPTFFPLSFHPDPDPPRPPYAPSLTGNSSSAVTAQRDIH